jgi:hypothetical protein
MQDRVATNVSSRRRNELAFGYLVEFKSQLLCLRAWSGGLKVLNSENGCVNGCVQSEIPAGSSSQ